MFGSLIVSFPDASGAPAEIQARMSRVAADFSAFVQSASSGGISGLPVR